MNSQGQGDEIAQAITEMIRLVQSGERIGAALTALDVPMKLLGSLADLDDELLPEIATASRSLFESAQALGRAFEFATARYEIRVAPLLPEGD